MRRHDLFLLAAGVTFYAVVALVPLTVVSLRLVGWVGGDGSVRSFARLVGVYLPHGDAADAVRALASAALNVRWPILVASLFPASLYAEGLRRALARLDSEQDASGIRGAVRSRVLALCGFVCVTVCLQAVASVGVAVTDHHFPIASGVYLAFVVGWGLATAALVVTYHIGSVSRLPVRALLLGAATTGSMVSGMTLGLILCLRLPVTFGRAYGGFTTAGVLATFAGWLWLLHAVLLVGFAYTRRLAQRCGLQQH